MLFKPVDIPAPARDYPCLGSRGAADATMDVRHSRVLPEEVPVALVYGGSTEAVMMATPADLEDFAVGFSLTEGVVERAGEITDLAVVYGEHGIELRMWLAGPREGAYRSRRRRMTGPTGCGLCGIESLAEAVRPSRCVADGMVFAEADIAGAIAAVAAAQTLNHQTHATHAAGFYRPGGAGVMIREDVGRHNALDKLAGALSRGGTDAARGAVVITSRVSIEMVQKTAAIGAPMLIAMSAPTALAVRTAEAANLTLVAIARGNSYQVFAHPRRIAGQSEL